MKLKFGNKKISL